MKLKRLDLINTGIDFIPVVNIVLILLMFFMITSFYMKTSAINIDLPEGRPADNQPAWEAVISISRSGTVNLDDDAVAAGSLGIRIKELYNKDNHLSIIIKADKSVPFGKMVEIMNTARLAGVKKISLATSAER